MFTHVTGCGNGKYLHINESVFKMGCDVCRPLVDLAWSRGHEVQLCDGLCLPYRDGCFDAMLSIAGIPHQMHIPLWFTMFWGCLNLIQDLVQHQKLMMPVSTVRTGIGNGIVVQTAGGFRVLFSGWTWGFCLVGENWRFRLWNFGLDHQGGVGILV